MYSSFINFKLLKLVFFLIFKVHMVICTMVHLPFHLDHQPLVLPMIQPYFLCCLVSLVAALLARSILVQLKKIRLRIFFLIIYLYFNSNTSIFLLLVFIMFCFINFLFKFILLLYFLQKGVLRNEKYLNKKKTPMYDLAINICLKKIL